MSGDLSSGINVKFLNPQPFLTDTGEPRYRNKDHAEFYFLLDYFIRKHKKYWIQDSGTIKYFLTSAIEKWSEIVLYKNESMDVSF